MHHRLALGFVLLSIAFAGCVDVPDSIRAQFAAPSPQERTNYRPGRHGTARPLVDPSPTQKAASSDVDAGAPVAATTTTSASTPESDGGVEP